MLKVTLFTALIDSPPLFFTPLSGLRTL